MCLLRFTLHCQQLLPAQYSPPTTSSSSSRYSFAIVGINLTEMAYRLLRDGAAKAHVYNAATSGAITSAADVTAGSGSKSASSSASANAAKVAKTAAAGVPELRHFHHLYSYLFVEFDKFWLAEKPRDIMEFNRIRDLFENNVRSLLADSANTLKINVTVENV